MEAYEEPSDRESKQRHKNNIESDLSSSEEEESFMQKLSKALFFGCGNGKEKEKSTMS